VRHSLRPREAAFAKKIMSGLRFAKPALAKLELRADN
jgi:hypothetical protein